MTILEAILLGIVQGATEFLPISSSGHTILIPDLFGLPEPGLILISIAHQGTLLAVLIYFWRDLWAILRGVLSGFWTRAPLESADARLGWQIAFGSIPIVIAGLTLEEFFEAIFATPLYAAGFLLVTSLLLVIGERLMSGHKELTKITWGDALIVGFFQTVALFPGISRSGSTITGGLLRGLERDTAARFSFLLGIPAILGAGFLALLDIFEAGALGAQLPVYAATFLAAAVTGYASIHFLLTWLREHTLYLFAVYTAAFGLFYLLLALLGVV
ncbi:MAG: undecaprenyl-diphosphate phosphatase [Candidatus Promineifilaceae bacterium]|nr:undecaprenyl-diphosphate phosphatase [Candidatus Promineifilaceae bacterium]